MVYDFEGEIPQSIGNLKNIKRIYLHTNKLSGQIPDNICSIYSNNENARIMLDANQLCPQYPACISEIQLGLTDYGAINQNTTTCELE